MGRVLSSSRLEAFSDGVIAVIITIMVLELKVPGHDLSNVAGLHAVLPLILVYLLSFVQVGIYWVNHHYMIDDVKQVTHGILWANLAFLFCLSLFPFATNWVAERGISAFSVSLYAATACLPGAAWAVLSFTIGNNLGLQPAGSRAKQVASSTLNLGAIAASRISPYLGLGMIAAVAILWLIPPARVPEPTRGMKPADSPFDSR